MDERDFWIVELKDADVKRCFYSLEAVLDYISSLDATLSAYTIVINKYGKYRQPDLEVESEFRVLPKVVEEVTYV